MERRSFVSVNLFHARHVRELCSYLWGPKPGHPLSGAERGAAGRGGASGAGRSGAGRGGAGRGGAERGGAGRSGAGRGGAGPNWLRSVPLDELDDCILGTSVSPNQSNSLNILVQARTKEFLFKLAEEQNPRLTTGLSPVYQRFITGTKSALRSWMPTSRSSPFCFCKPFSS